MRFILQPTWPVQTEPHRHGRLRGGSRSQRRSGRTCDWARWTSSRRLCPLRQQREALLLRSQARWLRTVHRPFTLELVLKPRWGGAMEGGNPGFLAAQPAVLSLTHFHREPYSFVHPAPPNTHPDTTATGMCLLVKPTLSSLTRWCSGRWGLQLVTVMTNRHAGDGRFCQRSRRPAWLTFRPRQRELSLSPSSR